MIISASYRTDLPAYHGRWFLERLAAGEVAVPNPYSGTPSVVSLHPSRVSGYVFWTRDPQPFLEALAVVRGQGVPFVVQMSLTGYPGLLEPRRIGVGPALRVMAEIRRLYGPRALVWRYDPVLITSETPPAFHRHQFARLAQAVARQGLADEVVVSWFHPYRKAQVRLDHLARGGGFSWRDPDATEKRALLGDMAAEATALGLRFSVCAQAALSVPGSRAATCIDAQRLSDLGGRLIAAKPKPQRPGCGCAEARDIGAYDTCPRRCVMCYARREGVSLASPKPAPLAD